MKVGFFGGTFNPPHIAHLVAAESVRDRLKLEKILFVPAAMPPHKIKEKIVPASHRLQMVKLAISGNPSFDCSDIELNREGPSFTIDTIRELKKSYSDYDLYLIIGVDLLMDFETWKMPEEILKECTVVAMNRPGFDLASVEKNLLLRVELVNVPGIDISSTSIRRRVKSGRSIRYLVPLQVEDYIRAKSIYM
ncbi:MAG: nicotinate-nucleotide adenylyltransferase [Bacteroidetes bacterium]|nr:nicotinate-nucleotide adenylyltransferase [Bacteroidota bacterium]